MATKKAKKKATKKAEKRLGTGKKARRTGSRRAKPEIAPAGPSYGTAGWMDLTVPNADEVRDFYSSVVGWTSEAVDLGGYSDYCMMPPGSSAPAVGVCHARGVNEGLPRCWLVYFVVRDVMKAVAEVERRGGRVLRPAGPMGPMGRFAVIEDPSGAACAVFEPAK